MHRARKHVAPDRSQASSGLRVEEETAGDVVARCSVALLWHHWMMNNAAVAETSRITDSHPAPIVRDAKIRLGAIIDQRN